MYYDVCTCMYRFGRVNFILALRLELLKEVERLKARCVHIHVVILYSNLHIYS